MNANTDAFKNVENRMMMIQFESGINIRSKINYIVISEKKE